MKCLARLFCSAFKMKYIFHFVYTLKWKHMLNFINLEARVDEEIYVFKSIFSFDIYWTQSLNIRIEALQLCKYIYINNHNERNYK